MKHLKTYESVESPYKVGDYVLLNIEKIKQYCDDNDQDYANFEIEDDMVKINYIDHIKETDLDKYDIEFYNGKNPNMEYVFAEEIKRLLTSQEIEIFKIKEDLNKYGI